MTKNQDEKSRVADGVEQLLNGQCHAEIAACERDAILSDEGKQNYTKTRAHFWGVYALLGLLCALCALVWDRTQLARQLEVALAAPLLKKNSELERHIGEIGFKNRKYHEGNETVLAIKGIVFDDVNTLRKSETANVYRHKEESPYRKEKQGRFTFAQWNNAYREPMLEIALKLEATDVLTYIKTQDGWANGISSNLVARVSEPAGRFFWCGACGNRSKNNTWRALTKAEKREVRLLWQENRETLFSDVAGFAELVDSLPAETKAGWDHFADQLKKNETATVRYIEEEHKKEMENYTGEENSCTFEQVE